MQYNETSTRMAALSVKRILTMTPYQTLINYINGLILNNGKLTQEGYSLSVNDLDDDELGNLAAGFIEYDDRDTSECFYEAHKYPNDDNITCAFLKLLKDYTPDNQEDFAKIIRDNAIRKYRVRIQEMIDAQCQDLYQSKMADVA